MNGVMPMGSYRSKQMSWALLGVGIIARLLYRLHIMHLPITAKYSDDFYQALFSIIIIIALFSLGYSKEKVEDERNNIIRLKALQISFMLTICPLLSVILTCLLHKEPVEPADILALIAFGQVLYHFIFNWGLHFDADWDYDEKEWHKPQSNILVKIGYRYQYMWQHRKSVLIYLACAFLSLIIAVLVIVA